MDELEQLKSILSDLENKEITKHQAHHLICILFNQNHTHEEEYKG